MSEPFDLAVDHARAIYRLWAEDDRCLYVRQTGRWHPAARLAQHRDKPWWHEVVRADYVVVDPSDDLDLAELEQIRALNPRYNVRGNGNRGACLTVTRLRNNWSHYLDQLQREQAHISVEKFKEPVAVVVPYEWYLAACKAMGEPPPNPDGFGGGPGAVVSGNLALPAMSACQAWPGTIGGPWRGLNHVLVQPEALARLRPMSGHASTRPPWRHLRPVPCCLS